MLRCSNNDELGVFWEIDSNVDFSKYDTWGSWLIDIAADKLAELINRWGLPTKRLYVSLLNQRLCDVILRQRNKDKTCIAIMEKDDEFAGFLAHRCKKVVICFGDRTVDKFFKHLNQFSVLKSLRVSSVYEDAHEDAMIELRERHVRVQSLRVSCGSLEHLGPWVLKFQKRRVAKNCDVYNRAARSARILLLVRTRTLHWIDKNLVRDVSKYVLSTYGEEDVW